MIFVFLVYTLSGIHMLETVAKPMLQMLEIQRESSSKRIQSLQAKLDQLSLDVNNEYFCDSTIDSDDDQENVSVLPAATKQLKKQKEKKSSMVSSSV